MSGCSIFPLLNVSGSLRSWQERYCGGDFTGCVRYQNTVEGKPVAPDLLPNGIRLGQKKPA